MHVDYRSINTEDFRVEHREHSVLGPVVLVKPEKGKFKWAPNELHLRSLVLDQQGKVLSAGFPKFFNFGECQWADAPFKEALARNWLAMTKKIDGSLIIRSVVQRPDGQGPYVYFRTRGSHNLGIFEEAVMAQVHKQFPKLLDPSIAPEGSALFEFTSPETQVVIRYKEPNLWPLAQVYPRKGGYIEVHLPNIDLAAPDIEINQDGEEEELPALNCLPPKTDAYFDFFQSFQSLAVIQKALQEVGKEEGFVGWAPTLRNAGYAGYVLTKFKTPWYVRLHGLRSQASPRYLREYCLRKKISTLLELQAHLKADGFDWETVQFLEPEAKEAIAHQAEIERQAVFMRRYIYANRLDTRPRKELALSLKQYAESKGKDWLFHYGINLVTRGQEEAQIYLGAQKMKMPVLAYRNLKKEWETEGK